MRNDNSWQSVDNHELPVKVLQVWLMVRILDNSVFSSAQYAQATFSVTPTSCIRQCICYFRC